MNANGLITVAAFAERWNIHGRFRVVKARRLLRRIEQKHEVQILVESGGNNTGRRYLVNLPRLKEVLPALFEGASPIELQAIKQDVANIRTHNKHVNGQIARLKERVQALENEISRLSAA